MIHGKKFNPSFAPALHLLSDIIQTRLQRYLEGQQFSIQEFEKDARWDQITESLQLPLPFTRDEEVILMLTIAPHIQPGFFERVIAQAIPQGGEFVEFGGVKGQHHRGMIATAETALFVLAGMEIQIRLQTQHLFSEDGRIGQFGLCHIETLKNGEPAMSGRLLPDEDWLEKILLGKEVSPTFSMEFPARKVSTPMHWDDLVLHPHTMDQVQDILLWMEHQDKVMQDPVLERKIKRGYRVLFYGPSGTGKTLTATLLGKQFDLPIYRIDLSLIVSKYIGETEKHIEWVFSRAERKKWILFFDEADALFGKRTSVQSAHDRFANQEVAYLLQRIEEYDGLLILASNFKNNIDDAFLRRFHNIIHFPMPNASERHKLWLSCVPTSIPADTINWEEIAGQYEITGAGIINVMHYAALRAFARTDGTLHQHDIVEGIKKEFWKEEKAL